MSPHPHGKVLVVPKTAATAAALAAVLLLGTACGSDDPSADPTPEPTSSSTTGSATPSPSPSDDPTSTVAPATGPLLKIAQATARVPDDWFIDLPRIVPEQVDAGSKNYSYSVITLTQIDSFNTSATADELGDQWLEVSPYPKVPKKLPTIELDGKDVYHIAGQVQPHLYLEAFGSQQNGKLVEISFSFSPVATPEERQEIIDSTLATFRWK